MPPRAREPSPPSRNVRPRGAAGGADAAARAAAGGRGGTGAAQPHEPPPESPRLKGKRSARRRASWLPQPAAAPAGASGGGARGGSPASSGECVSLPPGFAVKAPAAAAAARAAAPSKPPLPSANGDDSGARGGAPRPPAAAAAACNGGPARAAAAPAPAPPPPLAHGLADSAARAKAALGARHAQLCTSSDGVHYFAGEASGALVLPRSGGAHAHLLDTKLADVATAEGAINAVAGCDTYVVVRTTPDGNCLSHACSLGVWGVHDADAELRRAISGTMQAAQGAGAATRQRFTAALRRLGIPESEWDAEWRREIEVFAGSLRGGRGPPTLSRGFLSDVHCFVLANVLRRPLVIYGDAVALAAGLAGVYLPLLWGDAEGQPCSRVPTSLLFHKSHFSVLATLECADKSGQNGNAASADAATLPQPRLPLAVRVDGRATALPVRFLLPEEEGEAAQEALLRRWLDVVPRGAPGLPSGVTAFALPRQASGDALMALVEATVRGEC